jgi:hypothetical protein
MYMGGTKTDNPDFALVNTANYKHEVGDLVSWLTPFGKQVP